MSIRQWPKSERPRERLLQQGAQALSDAELLAIFLRTGVSGLSAVDLARDLLADFGGLRQILTAGFERFVGTRGLGPAKYAQLCAVLEMSRRHLAQRLEHRSVLASPSATKTFVQSMLRDQPAETFACLFLDNRHRLIACEPLFRGTVNGACVYPREIARRCLDLNAAAIVVAHNHPSGLAEPSVADHQLTQDLQQAMALLDIRLLDHLIIGDGATTSLAERGLL